jgi:hypothetical protein
MADVNPTSPALPAGMVYVARRDPNSPLRTGQQIEVSDDPHWIAAVRQHYQADLYDRLTIALRMVREGEDLHYEYRNALQEGGARAERELRQLMSDEEGTPETRTRAAGWLLSLGKPEGKVFLLTALRSGRSEFCTAALRTLGECDSVIDLTSEEVAGLIVKQFSSTDPEVVRAAAELCSWHRVPGAEQAVQIALANRHGPLDVLAETLVRLTSSPAGVKAALPYLFRQHQESYQDSIAFVYRRLIDHPDPAVALPLRQAMQRYLLSYSGDDRLGQAWAQDLSSVADASALDILKHLVVQAKDASTRAHALAGVARLEPQKAVDRMLAEIRRDGPREILLRLLRQHAGEQDFERIAAVLYPAVTGTQRLLRIEEAHLLLEKLGARGRDFLRNNLNRLEPRASQWVHWQQNGLDVRGILTELHKAGVITEFAEDVLDRLQEQQAEDGEEFDLKQPYLLYRALAAVNLTTTFDSATDQVPCQHQYLVQQFADGAAGRFRPECPVQTWHRRGADDFEGPYSIAFICNGWVYHFPAQNFGERYDVGAVVQALNAALEHQYRRERYIGLYTGDQVASFVFADPKVFVPIAQRYAVPL